MHSYKCATMQKLNINKCTTSLPTMKSTTNSKTAHATWYVQLVQTYAANIWKSYVPMCIRTFQMCKPSLRICNGNTKNLTCGSNVQCCKTEFCKHAEHVCKFENRSIYIPIVLQLYYICDCNTTVIYAWLHMYIYISYSSCLYTNKLVPHAAGMTPKETRQPSNELDAYVNVQLKSDS